MAYGARRVNAEPNNPIKRIDTYLIKVHFNIVLPSTLGPP